jgi:hypothetical protein
LAHGEALIDRSARRVMTMTVRAEVAPAQSQGGAISNRYDVIDIGGGCIAVADRTVRMALQEQGAQSSPGSVVTTLIGIRSSSVQFTLALSFCFGTWL